MNTTDMKKTIAAYKKTFKRDFNNVFICLKNEFNPNSINDSFLRHIIKGWEHSPQGEPGIHGHQRRMPDGSLRQAVMKLRNLNWSSLSKKTPFEDLYKEICKLFDGIAFCQGPLVCYDVAMRIGQLYGIKPDKYVYLSNGAKEGARRLLGKKRLPDIIERSEFPQPLCNEKSIYIEDILCTFKDAFLAPTDSKYRSVDDILNNTICHPQASRKGHRGCR